MKIEACQFLENFVSNIVLFLKEWKEISKGQYCVEKALNKLLFWYDQISSWVERKKASRDQVRKTPKYTQYGLQGKLGFRPVWFPFQNSSPHFP